MSLKYRADIDGLRAIAVLLVLFYHAGFKIISGGFIGVDVFFVISGFLITSIIKEEIENKEFRLSSFYIRRVKRILPSFYLVVFTTLFLGFFLLLPSDFVNLSKSTLASSLFMANIYFWKVTGGYFNSNADEMPLLHIWSLSVEEQFYFIWPLFLIFALSNNLKRNLVLWVIAIIVFLFLFSEWVAINKPNAAYYFLPTRAGELLIGAVLAIAMSSGFRAKKNLEGLISMVGIFLILFSAFVMSESSTFPGVNSFYPCLGAALVILSGANNSTFLCRLLSSKLFVFIGLISYPMYLWHWPIIAYLNYLNYELNYFLGFAVIVLTIILATLTWVFVEKKVRKVKLSHFSALTYVLSTPLIIVIGFSLLVINNDGFEKRLNTNPHYFKVKNTLEMPTFSNGWCYQTDSSVDFKDSISCSLGSNKASSKALFIGDSHAGHYQHLIDHVGKETGLNISTFITSNCFPSLYTSNSSNLGGNPVLCKTFRNEIKRKVETEDIDLIFLAARWDANTKWLYETKEALDLFSSRVTRVIILPQIPSYIENEPHKYLKSTVLALFNGSIEYQTEISYLTANLMVKDLSDNYDNVTFLSLRAFIGECEEFPLLSDDGLPYYFDSNHLNSLGSQVLTAKFIISPDGRKLLKSIVKD